MLKKILLAFIIFSLSAQCFLIIMVKENYGTKITFLLFNIFLLFLFFIFYYQPRLPWKKTLLKNRLFIFMEIFLMSCFLSQLHFWNQQFFLGYDFSRQKIHDLTTTTKEKLSLIKDQDQLVFTYIATRDKWLDALAVLKKYQHFAPIKIRTLDPDDRPQMMNQYNISKVPILIMEKGGDDSEIKKHQFLENLTEKDLTFAILQLYASSKIHYCFSTGHQEAKLQNTAPEGLSLLKESLQGEGHVVREINLANSDFRDYETQSKTQCTLVIWGPKDDFLPVELEFLRKWQNRGFPLIIALDPSFDKNHLTKLQLYFSSQKIYYKNGIIIDQNAADLGEEAINTVWYYPEDMAEKSKIPFARDLETRVLLQLSGAWDINKYDSPNAILPIMSSATFPRSWLETQSKELASGKLTFQESSGDEKGPQLLIFATKKDKESLPFSTLYISTSRIALNGIASYKGNFQFLLSAFQWIALESKDISLEEKNLLIKGKLRADLIPERLWITENQMRLSFFLSVIFFPLCFLLLAFWHFKGKKS